MWLTAFFTKAGIPETGLSAKVSIWRVSDNSLLVNELDMTEVGGGWYKYDFSGYDADIDYAIRFYGGATLLSSERYKYAGNENFIADIEEKISTSESNIRGGSDTLDSLSDQLDTVEASTAGKKIVDHVNHTETHYNLDGSVKQVYDLPYTEDDIKHYTGRVPQP